MFKLLLLLGITWVATTAEPACIKGPFPLAMACADANFEKGEAIKINNQASINNDIAELYIRNMSGSIDSTTFSLFPNIKDVTVDRCHLDQFEPNLDLEGLAIRQSTFPNITSEILKRYENLTGLRLENNVGSNIEKGAFKHLKNLEILIVSGQHLGHVTKGCLEGLVSLQELQLQTNIYKIDADAFDSVLNLKKLDLEDNDFTGFEPGTFKKLSYLTELSLVGCKNLQIADWADVFSAQKDLTEISLPTQLLKTDISVEMLMKVFPKLAKVKLEYAHRECQEVVSFVDELEKLNIETSHIYSNVENPSC